MIRTTTLAVIVLTAFATLAGAREAYPYPRPTPSFCEETPPPSGLDGSWRGDSGNRSTGPTFPAGC